jgi:hypothetical protein
VFEVATEADKEFVLEPATGNGNPATANNHILSVMNQVDAIFERQLNLSVEITFQHAWVTGANDPYSGFSSSEDKCLTLVTLFKDYWNANFPLTNYNYRRDVGHLFSLKLGLNCGGRATDYGTVCRTPENSYSFTRSLHFNKWTVVAHEFGHNLNAYHTDQFPPQPECNDTIMIGNIPNTNATEFCPYSVDQITNYVDTYGSCLHIQPNPSARTLFDFDADGSDYLLLLTK